MSLRFADGFEIGDAHGRENAAGRRQNEEGAA
jgi:hypothetical protein